jgi:D-alanine-D-alanine ligase
LAGRHIAVLLGGPSSEREVSLVSGAACADALERLGAKGRGSIRGATSPRC